MNETLIDYAYPMIMTEQKMKQAHEFLLERKWDKAIEQLIGASVELKIAINSVRHMQETQDAVRK